VLLGPRAALKLPIQFKNRPTKYPFTYLKENKEETVLLAAHEYPALAIFPRFAPPAYLDKRVYHNGIDVVEPVLVQLGGPSIKYTLEHYGAKTVRHRTTHHFDYYPRCILKMAYCFAVAALGLENIADVAVLPSILGQRDDAGMWLGCDNSKTLPGLSLHEHSVTVADNIIVRLNLFSPVKKIPEYIVVIGTPIR
jgi:hypothetical protein